MRLVDDVRGVLADDCTEYLGLSIIGADASHVYYSAASPDSPSFPKSIQPDKVSVVRVSKTAVKAP
ncbi:MAG: hypothetical protein KIT84_28980 [Labilithrix sp.]|nr:hypothetical protein [Labilithrix sp.]MCW5815095.1 hypothetical protein [Labilithrix sp.]